MWERLWAALRFAVTVRRVFHRLDTTTIGIGIGIIKGLCHKVHVDKSGIRHNLHVKGVTKYMWITFVFHRLSTGPWEMWRHKVHVESSDGP